MPLLDVSADAFPYIFEEGEKKQSLFAEAVICLSKPGQYRFNAWDSNRTFILPKDHCSRLHRF